jgi:hypothetical protein
MVVRVMMQDEGCRLPASPHLRPGTDDSDPRRQEKGTVPFPRRGGSGSPFSGRRPPVLLDNQCRIP